jgi:hypothetical protein
MSGGIFISYRRDDASSLAGRLFERLLKHFPQNKIFMDLDGVAHGEDLVKTIEKAIESSHVLIAVIGKRWLTTNLESLDDYVRLELTGAFKRNIRVIPVLVEGASMPRYDELPDHLKALATLNAWQISDANFEVDCFRLVSTVRHNLDNLREEGLEPGLRERQRPEAELREKERLDAEQCEKERLEVGQREKERLAAEQRQRENEPLLNEWREKNRLEVERLEAERRKRLEVLAQAREKHKAEEWLHEEKEVWLERMPPPPRNSADSKRAVLCFPSDDSWLGGLGGRLHTWMGNLLAKKGPVDKPVLRLAKRGAERDTLDSLASILESGNIPKEVVHRAVNVPGEPERSPVDCTVFAPDLVERERTGLLQAFLHALEARRQAEAAAKQFDSKATERGHRSLVLDAPIGTTFAFDVEIEGFVFHERTDTLLWTGEAQAATFRFDIPKDCKLGQHAGTVRIWQDGAPVGRITFQIEVVLDARKASKRPVGKEARHYNACFCSYSSLDRVEMLKRAQGIRATGLETFIDVMELRPGDIWNPKIFEAIDESDLFVVIWSMNARDSKWVRKESRYALSRYKQHGRPDFQPIPVEGPPIASVPRGLKAYHFNDELLGQIRAAELEMRARKKEET